MPKTGWGKLGVEVGNLVFFPSHTLEIEKIIFSNV